MEPLKIGLVCNAENGSPKVLAETLNEFIRNTTNDSTEVFYELKALKRLLPSSKVKYNKIIWALFKLRYFFRDKNLFKKLKTKDAIIVCSTTPVAFYNDSFNIKKFKSILNNKPILYYAVQYLENSPTQVESLKAGGHDSLKRFDWHLAVSAVTELRGKPAPPWNQIGMYLTSTDLKPTVKKEFYAIVDFVREGFEHYREEQIKVLEELNISYISLEKKYSMEDIRKIYQQASLFFIQFPEAYGLPIAECLACGSYVLTPDSSWPMAWRLDEKLEVHGPGELPECFVVYNDYDDLKNQLQKIKDEYDLEETPKKVFNTFLEYYNDFYNGNVEALKEVLERIREGNFNWDK